MKSVAVGDVNQDGMLDLVTANDDSGADDHDISILLGHGDGTFDAAGMQILSASRTPHFAAVADVNQDGRLDIVAGSGDTFLGNGDGTFQTRQASAFGGLTGALLDLNRDGKIDLAFGAEHGVAVFLGDGHGGFRRAAGSPFRSGKGTWRIEVVDVNNDGKPDFITNNVESDDISVLLAQ